MVDFENANAEEDVDLVSILILYTRARRISFHF
jgi:hypothetical protein